MASATLQWTAPADSRIVGYRVYYGTASRTYLQVKGAGLPTSTTVLTVGNLTVGRTYYFSVTSYDASGTESDYSAEATKTIQ